MAYARLIKHRVGRIADYEYFSPTTIRVSDFKMFSTGAGFRPIQNIAHNRVGSFYVLDIYDSRIAFCG